MHNPFWKKVLKQIEDKERDSSVFFSNNLKFSEELKNAIEREKKKEHEKDLIREKEKSIAIKKWHNILNCCFFFHLNKH